MKLALEAAGIDPAEMADDLGVSLQTVYNYMRGERHPKLGMIKLWSLRCGVPWEWVMTGELPGDNGAVSLRTHRGIGTDNARWLVRSAA